MLFLPPNFSGCQPFSRFDSQIQPIRKIRTFLGSFTKKISSVFSEIKRRFSLAFPADNPLLQQHSQSVFDGGFSYRRHAFNNIVLRELPYHIADGDLHQIHGRVFAFDSRHSFFEIPVSRQHCTERIFDKRRAVVLAGIPIHITLRQCVIIAVLSVFDFAFQADIFPDNILGTVYQLGGENIIVK